MCNKATSYYKKNWGFCITENQRKKLKGGNYKVVIDSELKDGYLTYGEIIIPGKSKKEVFISTYLCHPSMANNELSGPVVTAFLVKWLLKKKRKYTYRIIFIPETIGVMVYLNKHLKEMQNNIIAGFNMTCLGDNNTYSYIPTIYGNTYADRIANNVLKFIYPDYKIYNFLLSGSDEHQYNMPGVDLPVVSITRSCYGKYKEYHTSLDNLDFISKEGLNNSYQMYKKIITIIENNNKYKLITKCEPHFGKYNLYPKVNSKKPSREVDILTGFTAYSNGKNDLIDISNIIDVPIWELYKLIKKLKNVGLIKSISL